VPRKIWQPCFNQECSSINSRKRRAWQTSDFETYLKKEILKVLYVGIS
jgi:hypothetical protein